MSIARRPGRPAKTVYGTISAKDPVSGWSIAWSDGQFAGHPTLEAAARALITDPPGEDLLLPWGGGYVTPTGTEPLGALAIMADHTVCGPNLVLSGDVPHDLLLALQDLSQLDPDTDTAGVEAFLTGRGV